MIHRSKLLPLLLSLPLLFFMSPASSFDYPMFRITRGEEFIGTLIGTIHYLLSPTIAPKRIGKAIKYESDIFVLESDAREENIRNVRRNIIPLLEKECSAYSSASKENQEFLDDLARTTPGVDPALTKTLLASEWGRVVSMRAAMEGGDFANQKTYEGIERIILRVAGFSEIRFLESIVSLTKSNSCLSGDYLNKLISGYRQFLQCLSCQKAKSKEDFGYYMLDRANWRQEAGKMLTESLRYYGVDDSWKIRKRNKAWAERFVELTKEKKRLTTFVGVAHLVGEGSFIEELEKKGFTVTEIPWTDQDE